MIKSSFEKIPLKNWFEKFRENFEQPLRKTQSNFNFDLKDRWGNTPLDDIKDRAIREEVSEALKRRQFKARRGSLAQV